MAEDQEDPKPKASKMPMLIGLILALLGGGGGFYAASNGLIFGGADSDSSGHSAVPAGTHDPLSVSYVPIDPLIISISNGGHNSHLRFSAQLEVVPEYQHDVELLLPRVTDVLNGYLRAVELEDLTAPAALTVLRGQMLRRVQLVVGEGRVLDLLVMEFIVN